MKYLQTKEIQDPDSGDMVEIEIWKLDNGGIIGIDASYLDQVDDVIFNPFDGERIMLDTDT